MPHKMDASPSFIASGRSLGILAALVWYMGGIALLLKARSLLVEAEVLKPGLGWPWLATGVGVFLGGLKAKYLFSKSCQKNMDRIAALNRPRLWQFYRPQFFLALTVMISLGAMLSRLAHGDYPLLIAVAILDLSIAVALLGSSYVFWKQKAS